MPRGPGCWGRDEAEFAHRDGMITKAEVRAVALGKLGLPRAGVFWDVGAGSGSVAIECALTGARPRRHRDRPRPGAGRADASERGGPRRDRLRRRGVGPGGVRRPARPRPGLHRRRRHRGARRRALPVAAGRSGRRHVRGRRTCGRRRTSGWGARAGQRGPGRADLGPRHAARPGEPGVRLLGTDGG